MADETQSPGVQITIRAHATDQPTLDLLWRLACAYAQSSATSRVVLKRNGVHVVAYRTAAGHVVLRQMPD